MARNPRGDSDGRRAEQGAAVLERFGVATREWFRVNGARADGRFAWIEVTGSRIGHKSYAISSYAIPSYGFH